MFEPDYTETMSMLLDAIGRQQNDVLPREGLEADVAQFLKRQDKLSTADKIEKSEMRDVSRMMSIFERSSEYEETDDSEHMIVTNDSEKEELNFAEQVIDEFKDET